MTDLTTNPTREGVSAPGDWDPFSRTCPSRRLLDSIGDKWAILILLALEGRPLRYGEIEHAVDGISQKMLSQRLRTLAFDGLVSRTAHTEIPPRVVYELTDLGRSALPALRGLYDWTVANMSRIEEHRTGDRVEG